MCLAIPARIDEISEDDPLLRTGSVDFGGIVKRVSLVCVPDACVGDYVLVHVGMAISVIDQEEAEKLWSYLEELGERLDERTEVG